MYKSLDSIFVSVRVCVGIEETTALYCNELAGSLRPALNREIEGRAAAQFLGRIMPFFQIDKHFPSKASTEREQ